MDNNQKKIMVTQPFLPDLAEFIPYLEKIWERKWLTNNGEFHQQLEKELAEFLGVPYISLFSNGTLALVTAMQVLRITGEVITTPYSFVATTHALWWNGIKPVFVDIEPEFCTIDPEKIESAITFKTTAILPVHVYGNPANIFKIQEIADKYGLKVIYDACHAFGVKLKGQSVLNFGDLSVLSFHATKVFNTFEGGAIICQDENTKKRIDFLKNFGFADEVTVVAPGINAKMNEVQAAFGLLQLKYVEENIRKRALISHAYIDGLQNVNGIRCLKPYPDLDYNHAYFPIIIDPSEYGRNRDEVYDYLKANQIFSRKYFYPLISQFPTYRGLDSSVSSNLPVAEKIAANVLCLPIYPDLTMEEVHLIVSYIANFSNRA